MEACEYDVDTEGRGGGRDEKGRREGGNETFIYAQVGNPCRLTL